MLNKHAKTYDSRATRWLAVLLSSLVAGLFSVNTIAATPARTAKPAAASSNPQFVDGIAAVVNKDVITLSQVEEQLQSARAQLRQQKIQVPPDDVLRKQVLQRMITQKLEQQEADRLGIKVADAQVQAAVATVAQRNRMNEKQLRAAIEKTGVSWPAYLESLRDEVRMDMLRQRVVDSHIIVTDADIDNLLRTEGGQMAPAPGAPGQQQAARGQQGSMMVNQTHARHILIKTSKVTTDQQARTRLEQLRQRIVAGESFENLARRNSADSTAPQGGDLGWLSPGETVPAFEAVMDSLQPGQVSEPVQSQFGWHLIQVIERRTKDVTDEQKRMQARRILFERRLEPAFEEWLNELRGRAYIDNRLDPSANSGRR